LLFAKALHAWGEEIVLRTSIRLISTIGHDNGRFLADDDLYNAQPEVKHSCEP
jgi:hypothetical protein